MREERIKGGSSFEQLWCHLMRYTDQGRSILRVGQDQLVIYSGHIKFEIYIKYPSLGRGGWLLNIWLSSSGYIITLETETREL